jgi:hypothetical protein
MPGMAPLARIMALAAFGGLFSSQLAAFERVQAPPAKPEMTQNCPGLVAFDGPRIIPAALRLALTSEQVRLTYVGHSTFLIESALSSCASQPTTTIMSAPRFGPTSSR